MHLGFVERMLVSWSLIWWPRLITYLTTVNLTWCSRWMCRWWSVMQVSMEQLVCPM
jgi:hypothetical protein